MDLNMNSDMDWNMVLEMDLLSLKEALADGSLDSIKWIPTARRRFDEEYGYHANL